MDLLEFHRWIRRRGRSKKTAETYCNQLDLAKRENGGIVERLLETSLSPSTRRVTRCAARAYANYANDADLLAEVDDILLPRPERVTAKTPLTGEQWKSLIAQIESTDGNLRPLERGALLLLCRRGFRVGAIVSLTRRQLVSAVGSGTLVFESKGRRLEYGIKPIRKASKLMLTDEWDEVATAMCPKPSRSKAGKAAVDRLAMLLAEEADAAGLDGSSIYPHRLRHTCATEFYRRTKDIVALQQYMQWADISTAARYVAEMDRAALDDVAEEMLP